MKKENGILEISLKDLLEELNGIPKSHSNKCITLTEEQKIFLKAVKDSKVGGTEGRKLWNKKWEPISETSFHRRLRLIDG